MKEFINRVARLSPFSLYMFISGYFRSRSGKCEWCVVRYGKLKGIKLWINTKRSSYFLDMLDGKYDSFIYRLLGKFKPEGKVIWDIGAHIGFHSLGFAKIVGDRGRVIAIEPNKYNIQRLEKNMAGNPLLAERIVVINKALSSRSGKASSLMTDDVDSAKSSGGYLSGKIPPLPKTSYVGFKPIQVDVDTIDNILAGSPSYTPDIIKIDVEGAETDVLKGAEKLLEKYKPIIIAEIHNISVMLDVATILINKGYEISEVKTEDTSVSRCFIVATKLNSMAKKYLDLHERII